MVKRNVASGVIVGLLVALGTVLTAGNAYADETCGGGCGYGWGKIDGGFQFMVEDTAKDGYGVMGFVYRKSDGRVLASEYNGGGKGHRISFTVKVGSGDSIFQACLVDGPNHETIRCADKKTVVTPR